MDILLSALICISYSAPYTRLVGIDRTTGFLAKVVLLWRSLEIY